MRVLHSGDETNSKDQRYRTSGRVARTLYSLVVIAVIGYAAYFFGRPFLVLEGAGQVVAPQHDISVPYMAHVQFVHVEPGQLVYPGALLLTIERAGEGEALQAVERDLSVIAQQIDETRQALLVARRMEAPLTRRRDELQQALDRTAQIPDAMDLLTRAGLQREYSDAQNRWEVNRAQRENLPRLLGTLTGHRERLRRRHAEIRTTWTNREILAHRAGTVGTQVVTEGESLNAGEAMVRILDQSQRSVRWELPQTFLRLPRIGERVTIKSANQTVEGVVDRLLPLTHSAVVGGDKVGRLVDVSLLDNGKGLPLESSVTVRMGYF